MDISSRVQFLIGKAKAFPVRSVSLPMADILRAGAKDLVYADPAGRWCAKQVAAYSTRQSRIDPNNPSVEQEAWDLFQLFARGELRLTAHLRGSQLLVSLYRPGDWENMFSVFPLARLEAVAP